RSYGDWSSDVCSSDLRQSVAIAAMVLDRWHDDGVGGRILAREPGMRRGSRKRDAVGEAGGRDPGREGCAPGSLAHDAEVKGDREIGRASCRERGESGG